MKEYKVLISYYKEDEGWCNECIEHDTLCSPMTAEQYVNGMSDDEIDDHLEGVDGFDIIITDDDGNQLSQCYVDKDGTPYPNE